MPIASWSMGLEAYGSRMPMASALQIILQEWGQVPTRARFAMWCGRSEVNCLPARPSTHTNGAKDRGDGWLWAMLLHSIPRVSAMLPYEVTVSSLWEEIRSMSPRRPIAIFKVLNSTPPQVIRIR